MINRTELDYLKEKKGSYSISRDFLNQVIENNFKFLARHPLDHISLNRFNQGLDNLKHYLNAEIEPCWHLISTGVFVYKVVPKYVSKEPNPYNDSINIAFVKETC